MTKAKFFLNAAKPDEFGKTRLWLYTELENIYPDVQFTTKNGGDWCRDDGELKAYIVYRHKEKNKIVGIRLDGFRDNQIQKAINKDILTEIKKERCAVLDIGGKNIECDHKDGRYDSETYGDVSSQNKQDFQPLSRNVNLAKRQHCKVCKETNLRYDATLLGYSVGWIEGDKQYNNSCSGCYWYDPKKFNQTISENYL